MVSKYTGLKGLQLKSGFYKSVHKGEDAWLQKPGIPANPADKGSVSMDMFGVFDGHGGKQAATYASRNLLEKLQSVLQEEKSSDPAVEDSPILQELRASRMIDEEMWALWEGQDSLIRRLPANLTEAFSQLQQDFFKQAKVSGTTATVAVMLGWELVIANVGDSCAYLDTGSEVLQVSGNHRLDDCKAEQERIKSKGYEISSSNVEGRPCGPLRVWPGGLAMGRTLGDFDAGDIVLSQPEVRQVTLPAFGGRLIIASDGLWDAVAPKTAAHHVRGMPASKAARELGQAALKGKGLRDDITVLVVDLVPDEDHKMPPRLMKDGSGQVKASNEAPVPVNVYHPLEDGEAGELAWRQLQWERRLEALKAASPKPRPESDLQRTDSDSASADTHASLVTAKERQHQIQASSIDEPSEASDTSESSPAYMQGNPYGLIDSEATIDEAVSQWETVQSKSKAVPAPAAGRKHALPLSDGSPSTPWQVPKALREAPPSPSTSPMQTSDNLAPTWDPQSRGNGRRGRGRQRGRGRGPARGSQDQPMSSQSDSSSLKHDHSQPHQAPAQISGFRVHVDTGMGMAFLDGGGFSFDLQHAPQQSKPHRGSESQGVHHASAKQEKPVSDGRKQTGWRRNATKPSAKQKENEAEGEASGGSQQQRKPKPRHWARRAASKDGQDVAVPEPATASEKVGSSSRGRRQNRARRPAGSVHSSQPEQTVHQDQQI